MQLTPPAAFTFGVTNRFRVDENIRGGVAYLARLMRLFNGELRLVAAAYYAGEVRIRKNGLDCADPDICRYVGRRGKVLSKTAADRSGCRKRSITAMKALNVALVALWACCISVAQVPEITPQVQGGRSRIGK